MMNRPIKSWVGRRVWIIGASQGIGAALAHALHQRGAHLALSARRLNSLSNATPSNHALLIPLDVQDEESIRQAHTVLMSHWSCIDLVLILAGTYQPMRADNFDLHKAEEILDVNLNGVYRCLDQVLPDFFRQGYGGLGIVASVAGYSGLPQTMAYGPSKAALINLCEGLYFDLQPKNINLYLINPGFVTTRLTEKNDFDMPGLIDADDAALAIIKGMEKGQFHIHFPRRFTNWLRLARLLPYRGYFYLVQKLTGQ